MLNSQDTHQGAKHENIEQVKELDFKNKRIIVHEVA
jgi:hypothetical protein